MNYDLIVIGGGPAGYVGAIRAAQLGKKVACIEKERAGGTCLNWGCIPTKALLRNAELYHTVAKRSAEFGFSYENLGFDWAKIIARSRDVSDKNATGIEFLFKKNKIDYLRGEASLEAAGTVKVKSADSKEETHTATKILVATGCVSRGLKLCRQKPTSATQGRALWIPGHWLSASPPQRLAFSSTVFCSPFKRRSRSRPCRDAVALPIHPWRCRHR